MGTPALHVLVIGGGIGGLCLAHGLRKAGISVAVYERDHTPAAAESEHYSLQINAWGNRALHACLPEDLWAVYLAMAGQPLTGMRFVTEQLRPLLSVQWPSAESSEEATWRISRHKLRQILLADLEDIVHLGKRFVRFENTPDERVSAYFEDGTSALGDVLVGADGVASNVRKQLLPQAQLHDLEVAAIGAKLPLERTDSLGLSGLVANRMMLVLPPRGGGMFVTQFARRRPSEAFCTDRLELRAPDLEDHVFWALIARRARFGSPSDLRRQSAVELRELASGATRTWSPNAPPTD
jgi:2-polyprenyl-6-methoxyphenol hydroxylase-like FAD-dependent oxidoreductase